MQKPTTYDEVQAQGGFTPVELGGHYAVIKQVTETKSKKGKDMIVVVFDFQKPDAQAGYFAQSFKDDIRPDKKWPHNGTNYVMVNDYMDATKVSRSFKTFCTCVEKSNKGFTISWGDNWGAQFKNKKIGVVFGEVENEYNGNISMRHEVRWFCDWDRVKDSKVPQPKYLNGKSPAAQLQTDSAKPEPDGFMSVPEGEDEEIPF